MLVYRRKGVRRVHVWFDEEPNVNGFDLIHYYLRPTPISDAACTEIITPHIDLTKSSDELMANIKKYTRYEIRRAAEQDQTVYEYVPSNESKNLTEFCDLYDEFAYLRGKPKTSRYWLSLLAQCGLLEITRTSRSDGKPLVWHAYYKGKDRVTLLYTASLYGNESSSAYRNMIGRANRFHHWQDIMRYKSLGLSTYDLGGWYPGKTDVKMLNINRFKAEFGGTLVKEYNCHIGKSIRGKLILRYGRLLKAIPKITPLPLFYGVLGSLHEFQESIANTTH